MNNSLPLRVPAAGIRRHARARACALPIKKLVHVVCPPSSAPPLSPQTRGWNGLGEIIGILLPSLPDSTLTLPLSCESLPDSHRWEDRGSPALHANLPLPASSSSSLLSSAGIAVPQGSGAPGWSIAAVAPGEPGLVLPDGSLQVRVGAQPLASNTVIVVEL